MEILLYRRLQHISEILFSLVFIELLIFIPEINAQLSERDFIHYTVKDGLSDNTINCIAQDDKGYIWIGTDAGLNRFDGHHINVP